MNLVEALGPDDVVPGGEAGGELGGLFLGFLEILLPLLVGVGYSGELCGSDFTSMNELNVTIEGQSFDHLLYHFVLQYSNWEDGTICFSESFENLSEGFQNGLWELGGVPEGHRTDRLSAAVHKDIHPDNFTRRYQGLLDHYGLQGHRTNAESPTKTATSNKAITD